MSLQTELEKVNNPNVTAFVMKVRRRSDLPFFLFSQNAVAGAIRIAAATSGSWQVDDIEFPDSDTVTARFSREDTIQMKLAGINPTVAAALAGVIFASIAAVVVVVEISPVLESAPHAIGIGFGFVGAAVAAVAIASVVKNVRG